ncbi:DUF3833 family protein [Granulosicoccus sp. 3-233]|uniref:DUF3833 family protein n=1 Tax=Granulosicoccus sp. 3-233 TaxID=3417969 RepID=UPI003D34DD01
MASACSTMKIDTIPINGQDFLVEEYFAGNTRAHGIVLNRGGSPIRYFKVHIEGLWDEQTRTLTLNEDFIFDDGEISQRIWEIKRMEKSRYTGTADDVEGVAIGFSRGNALNWQYTLNIPWKQRTLAVQLDDWMYLQDDVLINRAVMRKFGVRVGEILIAFDKQNPTAD